MFYSLEDGCMFVPFNCLMGILLQTKQFSELTRFLLSHSYNPFIFMVCSAVTYKCGRQIKFLHLENSGLT